MTFAGAYAGRAAAGADGAGARVRVSIDDFEVLPQPINFEVLPQPLPETLTPAEAAVETTRTGERS